jgi:hypothetical protein
MKTAFAAFGVFAILLAPFFLFLAVLRFVPPEKRWRIVSRPTPEGARSPKWLVALQFLAGLF